MIRASRFNGFPDFQNMASRSKSSRRGFVGPLGDDIPSIFPIVLGVLLFLTSLGFAANLVSEKNTRLEISNAALKIAYTVTQTGNMDSGSFAAQCGTVYKPQAEGQHVFIRITLNRFCRFYNPRHDANQTTVPASELAGIQPIPGQQDQPGDVCTNENPDRPQNNPVILQYPIAVPCPNPQSDTYGLGMVNILAWR